MKFSRRAAVVLALVATFARPAAAASPDLVAAAEREGEVVWYTSFVQNQVARPMAEAFQKAYPKIRVTVVAGPAGDLLTRMLLEAKSGGIRADVGHGGSSVRPLQAAGVMDTFVPGPAEAFPPGYRDAKGQWTAQIFYFLGAAANTTMVSEKDEPKSYEDLLDPRWAGKLVWTNTMVQGGPLGFIGTVMSTMGPEKGRAYLQRLSAQKVVNLPANQRVVLDQVIAGEYPIALMVFNNHVHISKSKDAPIKFLKIEPVLGIIDPVFIVKGPHPNAARLFVEFLVSKDGQAVFQQADYIPVHPDMPPLNPALRPAEGGFKAALMLPELYDEGVDGWRKIYDEVFK